MASLLCASLSSPAAWAEEGSGGLAPQLSESAAPDTVPAVSVSADESGVEWTVDGEYRLWMESRDGFPIGADGEALTADAFANQIAQLGGTITFDKWLKATLAVRVLSGAYFAPQPCLTNAPANCVSGPGGDAYPRMTKVGDSTPWTNVVLPRDIEVDLDTGAGLLRIGHQTSSWGLGIMANDGREDPNNPLQAFNDRVNGDLVERVMFITRPGRALDAKPHTVADAFVLGLGADLVFLDENASLVDGDVAFQGILVAAMRPERAKDAKRGDREWELGTYSVFRRQDDADGAYLTVGAFDLYGRLAGTIPKLKGQVLGSIAGEAAWTVGWTDRTVSEGGPTELFVNGFGYAVEGLLEFPKPEVKLGIRLGMATGDANSDDDTLYRFTFDRDFKAGLVLFDTVLAETSAISVDRASDPERSAYPPKGIDHLPTNGAITGAFFVNPVLTYEPLEGMMLALGGLWARASAPLMDPVETFANGGVPANVYGVETDERALGMELDTMLRYRFPLFDGLELEARAEYGIFMFGGAFQGPHGDRPEAIHTTSGRMGLYW
ncbi:MAG: hypothetical protein CO108_00545 [Deltaproteobacteria bacterium CG_4_9_14_3_um_filter_63_12]|nr:MAG: hypothetical protein CO108_00545 [Deltaproteobacteria bacterium CG_4_9_14_3_um_filter_63_12]